jgi:hypothetical protein
MKERNHTTFANAVVDTKRNWKAGQTTTGHLISLLGKCINISEAREKQMMLETKNVNLATDSISEHCSCCQNESHGHACRHTYTQEGQRYMLFLLHAKFLSIYGKQSKRNSLKCRTT